MNNLKQEINESIRTYLNRGLEVIYSVNELMPENEIIEILTYGIHSEIREKIIQVGIWPITGGLKQFKEIALSAENLINTNKLLISQTINKDDNICNYPENNSNQTKFIKKFNKSNYKRNHDVRKNCNNSKQNYRSGQINNRYNVRNYNPKQVYSKPLYIDTNESINDYKIDNYYNNAYDTNSINKFEQNDQIHDNSNRIIKYKMLKTFTNKYKNDYHNKPALTTNEFSIKKFENSNSNQTKGNSYTNRIITNINTRPYKKFNYTPTKYYSNYVEPYDYRNYYKSNNNREYVNYDRYNRYNKQNSYNNRIYYYI